MPLGFFLMGGHAELNAELERGRFIAAGHPPDEEPYMELRDTSKLRERDDL